MKKTFSVLSLVLFFGCGEETVKWDCSCDSACDGVGAKSSVTICATQSDADKAAGDAVNSCQEKLAAPTCTEGKCECQCTTDGSACTVAE